MRKSLAFKTIIELHQYLDDEYLYDRRVVLHKPKVALMSMFVKLFEIDLHKRLVQIADLEDSDAIKALKHLSSLTESSANKIANILNYDPANGEKEVDSAAEWFTSIAGEADMAEMSYDIAHSYSDLFSRDLDELEYGEKLLLREEFLEYESNRYQRIEYRDDNIESALLFEEMKGLERLIYVKILELEDKVRFLESVMPISDKHNEVTLRDFITTNSEDKENILAILKSLIRGNKGRNIAISLLAINEVGYINLDKVNRSKLYDAIRAETGENIGTNSGINLYIKNASHDDSVKNAIKKEVETHWS